MSNIVSDAFVPVEKPVKPAAPTAAPLTPEEQAAQFYALSTKWQSMIYDQVKSINSKLSWFVLLSILAVIGGIISFLGALTAIR